MPVLQQTVSLAAQPRAFSSLLSLPSQAQSVIKAFRRQGIGSADVINTARFFLSRIESLSALLQVFQIFQGRAELAASLPMARQCDLFRSATAALHKSHRLAYSRIKVASVVILSVGLCVRLLPRTDVLACSRFQKQFVIRLRGRQITSSTVEPKDVLPLERLCVLEPHLPHKRISF